ncbi:MAG TPA: His/Gly/Thr/Pro-type tRNA ligase C-terminal domain-containing protein, partial [Candidatus Izemoplasmatales bacterium]|nr:His/Gly/Thr/Pro-type tRNA ligase C-terminal domain-containing protein [Candidatus Izemoplasmatales bacterium]
IQLDMNLPERFDLTYINDEGERKRPVMLHRALYGSIERFIGILIEHYAGAFPTWMAPVQVVLIPVNNDYHLKFTKQLKERFEDEKIRIHLDDRDEKLGYKIREAQTKKVPYQLVIGDNEIETKEVTYRRFGEKKQVTVKIDAFIDLILNEINNKE